MEPPVVPELGPSEAVAAIETGAVLLDVREPEEWAAGRAPAAVHIALGELGARIGELDASAPIVVVCRVGGRSLAAAQALRGAGYDASNLTGGMLAWAGAGLELVADDGPGFVL